jgi:hypothetical protein
MTADGHRVVEFHIAQLADELGTLARNIHTGLGHDAHGVRVQAVGFEPGRVRFDLGALQVACPPFRHLAPAGIARTQE